jgi:hypothetical protein
VTDPPHISHPESVDYESVGKEERALPPPSALEALVAEVIGAVPEVRDSLLTAADALLDAARAVIDAVERVLHNTGDESES